MEERVKELHIYSEKVGSDAFRNLFEHLTKRKVPLFGFLDLSYFFSITPAPVIVQRQKNTLKFYIKDRKNLAHLPHLIFPFKLSDNPVKIERKRGSYLPFPNLYFFGPENLLNFMIKADVEEFSCRIVRIFGKYLGFANATESGGKKNLILLSSPENFLEINLENHPSIYIDVLEPIPKSISLNSQFPVFENVDACVGMDSFESINHTLIVGESGCGKTKALYMMVRALEKKYGNELRVLVIDPHGEFLKLMPNKKIVDYKKNYVEPLEMGGDKSPMMTQLIAQLISSAIGEENKYAERVLFYATYLLSSIDRLTLENINALLRDPAARMEFCTQSTVDEAKRFFDQEYQDIYIHHFNDAVLPILNFVGEYELYLGKKLKQEKLHELLENNRVTVVSFDPQFFGKRMIKFLAGAVINQMYICAITGKFKRPIILVVDEFPRVETLVVKDILAETRKFNLYLYLSMQYLGQLKKEILNGIISNTRNIISFKVNREDARLISSIIEIKIEEFFKKNRSTTELEESKREMFVRLDQRECIVRLFDGTKYILPMKLKAVDVQKWMYPEDLPPPSPSYPPYSKGEIKKEERKEKVSGERGREKKKEKEEPKGSFGEFSPLH
ncbi:hypothetical protein AUJ17_01840 [Candidatus Micrarchaeota archaeon CG1_02_47_40]|nr:MAG: hypothetical protein AUJ17_01840 [Candidatus Micrarchaeota archaeon CG1_02_47_40]